MALFIKKRSKLKALTKIRLTKILIPLPTRCVDSNWSFLLLENPSRQKLNLSTITLYSHCQQRLKIIFFSFQIFEIEHQIPALGFFDIEMMMYLLSSTENTTQVFLPLANTRKFLLFKIFSFFLNTVDSVKDI